MKRAPAEADAGKKKPRAGKHGAQGKEKLHAGDKPALNSLPQPIALLL
jgi:hypothetical protein